MRVLKLRTEGSGAINKARRERETGKRSLKCMCKGPKAGGSGGFKEVKESKSGWSANLWQRVE